MLIKLEWLGYRGEKKYDDILSRFHTIPERNGQTDGWTDRLTDGQSDLLYQYRALVCLRAIKIDWKNKTKTFSELKEIPVVITGNYFLGFTLERICETGSILRDKSGRQMTACQNAPFHLSRVHSSFSRSACCLYRSIVWLLTRLFCRIRRILLIFTARRICIARTMPWQDVRLSVRHTPVLCVNSHT